jgi:ABC-type transport system involved in multi-copper enzyme maturation permease subunit
MILFAEIPAWLSTFWLPLAGAAGALAILFGLYGLLSLVFPKVVAIARTTAKEAIAQPLFYAIVAFGAFLLVIFPFVPYNTFGEDIKMVKDSGLTLIMVLAIILALWTASVSVADEIEGRTALTLLSKPIGRRQFIIGKFLGIIIPVALVFIILSVFFLGSISYKLVYDARETAKSAPTAEQCIVEMKQIVPGLVLAFLETVVLTSISVAISTRLPMLANLIICSSIYVVGHLGQTLVNATVDRFEPVRFVGQFIATVLPVLDHFNITAAVSTGKEVPLEYLGVALVYCLLYSSFALLFALFLFEDRDLA